MPTRLPLHQQTRFFVLHIGVPGGPPTTCRAHVVESMKQTRFFCFSASTFWTHSNINSIPARKAAGWEIWVPSGRVDFLAWHEMALT